MALQDIKYVMSVDDGQAKRAIASTVKNLSTLDNTKFGGQDAERFAQAIGNMGTAASGALSSLGSEIGSIFGGSFLGNALGDSVGEALSTAVMASTGTMVTSFGAAGTLAGFALGASYLKASGVHFRESANVLGQAISGVMAKLNVARLLPKIDVSPLTSTLSGALEKGMANLKINTGPMRRFLANQLAGFAVGLPTIIGNELSLQLGKLAPVTNAMKNLGTKLAGPLKGAFSNAFAGIGTIAASAMTVAAGAVSAGVLVIGGAFAGIAMYANSVWSEVEDGVMKAQAAMVSLGASVEQAFSEDVSNRILEVTETLAYGLGAAPKDVAEATANLMKNGMDLEQALSRMSLAQNIATVNGMTMAQASDMIVRAWSGEVEALKEIGIRMKSSGDISKDAALAMEKLISRYGDPALSKPFIDDDPMRQASAAVTDLWAKLGQALDPAMTAAWQALADVILGVTASLKDSTSGDFVPTVEGVLAAIGATVSTVINASIVIGNVVQMLITGVTMIGQTIWYGAQFGWAWLEGKLADMLSLIGEAVSLIPGTGDAGENLKKTAEGMKTAADGAMDTAGKAFTDAAMSNFNALKRDAQDIGKALSPDGGVVGDLQRKGRAAREQAQRDAMAMAQDPKALGESERVREERERKAKEEAEKRMKKQKQTFEQNRRIQQERSRYNQNRATIVLQTPQRMNAALRFSR